MIAYLVTLVGEQIALRGRDMLPTSSQYVEPSASLHDQPPLAQQVAPSVQYGLPTPGCSAGSQQPVAVHTPGPACGDPLVAG